MTLSRAYARFMESRKVLVVVAHPDDESIFFFGTLGHLVQEGFSVQVLCATGDFGNSEVTSRRLAEFRESCADLGVSSDTLGLEDRRGNCLESSQIKKALQGYVGEAFHRIYTHGPWGEYGHLHHVSVCRAVHELFGEGVYMLAGPLRAVEVFRLSSSEYKDKLSHLRNCYPSQQFAWSWASKREEFVQLHSQEVEVLTRVALCAKSVSLYGELPSRGEISCLRSEIADGFLRGYSQQAELVLPSDIEHIPCSVWRDLLGHYWRTFCDRSRRADYRFVGEQFARYLTNFR